MKKIIIISNTIGVVYKFKFELLKVLLNKGYELFLFAQNEEEDSYLEEIKKIGVNYIEVKLSRRGINPIEDLRVFFDYYKEIKKIKPEFIYTFTIKPNLYAGLVARILKIKYASTVTGLGTSFQKKTIILKILKKVYKESLKNAEGVFFENINNLNFFVESKILSKEKAILLSGSGVNLKKFYPLKKIRKDNNIVFLFIGRIMKEKGIEEFLEAAEHIIEKNKKIEFWVIGSYEEKKYTKLIKSLEKQKVIKYLGNKNDVREIIKEVDFLIQPSYHEGLSNVILEASAMGKLVLASNIPGCREAIYDKKYLFPSKDSTELINCIERVLNQSVYINQKDAFNQRKYVEKNFSRELVIEKNVEILFKKRNRNERKKNYS